MIEKVWFTKDQVALPEVGLPETLLLCRGQDGQPPTIQVRFPQAVTIEKIAENRDFAFNRTQEVKRLLEVKLDSSGNGTLAYKGSYSTFSIPQQTSESGIIAWVKIREGCAETVTIVDPGGDLPFYGMEIKEGGVCRASSSLGGKTVTVLMKILVPYVAERPTEKVPLPPGAISLHAIGMGKNNTPRLLSFLGCRCIDFEPVGNYIDLTLAYESHREIPL